MKSRPDINILIVDDNKENLYSLKSLLETGSNYRFLLAQSGEECLKIAIKENITLIILDVQMPGMDGYETASILKGNSRTKKIPLIFITAVNHDNKNLLKGFDAGALDYIFKPVEPEILKAKVANYVSFTEAQKALKMLNNKLETKVLERTRQLEDRNLELEGMNRVLDNFLHVTAHDLRAPLSNIMLLSELLKMADAKDEKMKLVNTLTELVRRLDITVKGIVEMMEVQEKRHTPAKKINLKKLFESIRIEIAPQLESVNGTITSDFSKAGSIFYIPVYIESIFRNILNNSLKYRSPKRKLEIMVSSWNEAEFTVIEIKDNGIGIDLEKYGKKLFTPFSRINKNIEGKGIGLHLVRNMIEMNKGKVEVSSVPDGGTSFSIYLKNYLNEKHTLA